MHNSGDSDVRELPRTKRRASTGRRGLRTSDGSQPIDYQWRFNGSDIPGANLSSFSNTNIQFSDAGSYSVMMTNAFGSNLSSSAALSVLLPNQIAFDPFGYASGSGLAGQVNANGQSWSAVGPSSGTRPLIVTTQT